MDISTPRYILIMILLLSSPLLVVYRVDVVDEGVLIFIRVCNFRLRFYIRCDRMGWIGCSGTGVG